MIYTRFNAYSGSRWSRNVLWGETRGRAPGLPAHRGESERADRGDGECRRPLRVRSRRAQARSAGGASALAFQSHSESSRSWRRLPGSDQLRAPTPSTEHDLSSFGARTAVATPPRFSAIRRLRLRVLALPLPRV